MKTLSSFILRVPPLFDPVKEPPLFQRIAGESRVMMILVNWSIKRIFREETDIIDINLRLFLISIYLLHKKQQLQSLSSRENETRKAYRISFLIARIQIL